MDYYSKNICSRLTEIGAVDSTKFIHFYVDDVNAYHGNILSVEQIKNINRKHVAGQLNVCIEHIIPAIPTNYPIKVVYQSELADMPKDLYYVVLDEDFHVSGNPKIVSSKTYNQMHTTTSTVSRSIQLCIFPSTIT